MRYAIVGSRTATNITELIEFLETVIPIEGPVTHIISGGAKGADTLAMVVAMVTETTFTCHEPDYEKYGSPAAHFVRNRLIVDDSDVIVALWDGKSTGTKNTIDYARKQGKKVYIKIIAQIS